MGVERKNRKTAKMSLGGGRVRTPARSSGEEKMNNKMN